MNAVSLTAPALAGWLALALVAGVALGVTLSAVTGHRPDRSRPAVGPEPDPPDAAARAAAAPPPRAAPEVDDLPGFLEHPPGSPAPPPSAAAPAPAVAVRPATSTGATAVRAPATAGRARHTRHGRPIGEPGTRRTLVLMVLVAAVLVLAAVVIALVDRAEDPTPGGRAAAPAAAPGTTAPHPEPPGSQVPAGALAARSVPLGDHGVAARATFGSVLLERRAVGVTVTRPGVSTSTDGTRALAHVVLPAFNCLTREPPADPEAAGCARAATEYADLADPELRLRRDGDRLELTGRFPTYTRPREGPPTYTGRSYPITVTLAADGRERDGRVPVTGVLRQGVHRTTTTGGPDQNVLQLR